MSYEGWSNYETWNIALWFDNDEGLNELKMEMCDEADGSKGKLAKMIESTFEDVFADQLELPAGPVSDLLNQSIREIDWHEIAGNWIADWELEQDDEDDEDDED